MKNVTILFAVLAVVALSAPAFGNATWLGGVGDWDVPTNWIDDSTPPVNRVPNADDYAYISTGGVVTVDAGGCVAKQGMIEGGIVKVVAGGSLVTKGTIVYGGALEISGGHFEAYGWSLSRADNATVRVIGSASTITVASVGLKWNGAAILEIVPDDNGAKITPIMVGGSATVKDRLVLDVSNYTPVLNEELLIMDVTGTLDTTALTTFTVVNGNQDDWLLIKTDGEGGSIVAKCLVPEPATMVLLGLGGIGVLIRRRKK